jgi:hypothetical protein
MGVDVPLTALPLGPKQRAGSVCDQPAAQRSVGLEAGRIRRLSGICRPS